MKKLLFALFIVMMISGIASAQITNIAGNTSMGGNNDVGVFAPQAQATALGGTVVAPITNINTPVNVFTPTNIQGQMQGQRQGQIQGQGQFQGQNNDQVIAPSQEINIQAPKIPKTVAIGTAPNMTDSELNFISPNERDVQTELPKFGCDTVKPIKVSDCMIEVIWQSNDIKFKDLYTEVLKGLRSKEVQKYRAKAVRYQIREAASTKTWTTGGEVAANAVGMIGSAASGVTGGLIPKVGRSKSSNLYTVFFILVQEFKN